MICTPPLPSPQWGLLAGTYSGLTMMKKHCFFSSSPGGLFSKIFVILMTWHTFVHQTWPCPTSNLSFFFYCHFSPRSSFRPSLPNSTVVPCFAMRHFNKWGNNINNWVNNQSWLLNVYGINKRVKVFTSLPVYANTHTYFTPRRITSYN